MENVELSEYHIFDKQSGGIEEEFTTKKFGHFATVPRLHEVMCTVPLVTPTMEQTWTVYKTDGTTEVSNLRSTASSLILETGYKVKLQCRWKWVERNDYVNPTRTSGICGVTLPTSNVFSSYYTESNIASNKSFTQTIYRERTAPTVSNNVLVKPTGELSNACSCSVNFRHRRYFGINTNADQTNVTDLTDGGLQTSRAYTTPTLTTADGQYYHYIYPTALGALAKIIQNGATPVLDAFSRKTINIVNAAGATIECYCYTTKNSGALKGDTLAFS